LRVVYFHWLAGRQFWLFTLYNKDEVSDLTAAQRRAFKKVLEAELEARKLDG
jgi:hypothetical protein